MEKEPEKAVMDAGVKEWLKEDKIWNRLT